MPRPRDVISAAYPGSASGPSPRARCLQHQLLRDTWSDAWTTSSGWVRCGGLKARLWVPPKHLALYPVHIGWSPATLQRKLSSVTWIRDLLLSVSTQRSRLQVCRKVDQPVNKQLCFHHQLNSPQQTSTKSTSPLTPHQSISPLNHQQVLQLEQ